ncbi:MAG: hypothetical protein AAF224_11820 [Pseudomonadota bacterium]
MVTEVRQINFGSADLIDALVAFRESHADFLPAGRIFIRGVAKSGMLRIQVSMNYGEKAQNAIFDIGDSDVLRVVIHACEVLEIPMPRMGKKSIAGSVKGVCLTIKVDPDAMDKSHDIGLGEFSGARRLDMAQP